MREMISLVTFNKQEFALKFRFCEARIFSVCETFLTDTFRISICIKGKSVLFYSFKIHVMDKISMISRAENVV